MRLIDADALLEFAKNRYYKTIIPSDIVAFPTIDAVEVVRCRDCKHWHEETSWCTIHSHFVDAYGMACHPWESADWKMLQDNDFCSYGERRTECD